MISCTISPVSNLKMTDCHLHSCRLGISGARADLNECVVEHSSDRGISVTDGSTVTRSVFRDIQNRSGVIIQTKNANAGTPILQSVVRDCYFNMPASAHGQPISLYRCSWQNAVIEHNIFDDCQRAISFQPNTSSSGRRTTAGDLRIANNLIVYNDPVDSLPGGQSTISFNGATDEHLGSGTSQRVTFEYNTVVILEDVLDDPSSYTLWTVDLQKLIHSDVRVEGNVSGIINASMQENEDGSLPHWRSGNLMMLRRYGETYGEYDLPTPESVEDVLDPGTLTMRSYGSNSAADGGPVGIRWQAHPDPDELYSLGVRWADVYPASPLPSAAVGGFVYFGEDRRP